MKRLYKMTNKDLSEWMAARQEAGKVKYGNKHLKRYNAVDVAEELLDAINITNKWIDRLNEEGQYNTLNHNNIFNEFKQRLVLTVRDLQYIDKLFPDTVCTDEEGGGRIWWNDNDR